MTHPPISQSPDLNSSSKSIEFPPLILTLKLDANTFDRLNQLRQEYFPRHRNFLTAHVSMFHALPGEEEQPICKRLHQVCAQTPRFPLVLPTLRFLGKGFAAELEAPELIRLHQQLAAGWHSWLTPQDRQKYKPHVTIQNKVLPEAARSQYEQAAKAWQPLNGFGEGLLLWYYKGGPWELVETFGFQRTEG